MIHCTFFFIILCPAAVLTQTLEITNGPMNTTVCTGSIASMSCGFVNESVNFVPNWRIVRRSDNGSVISNMIVSSNDIVNNNIDGLEWVTDTTSGDDMSPNSRLLVGPVNETYNQSSYQCIFTVGGNTIESSVGTLTVTGPPSIGSVTNEICLNDIMLSWIVMSNLIACGSVSYNVTILSEGMIIRTIMTTNTSYNITELTPGTNYIVSIEPSDMAGSGQAYTEMIRTAPNTDLAEVVETCLTYIIVQITPIDEMFCGGAVTYTTTVLPSNGHIVNISKIIHNITGLTNNSPYMITVDAWRGDNRVHQTRISQSTLDPLDLPTVTNIRSVSTICVTYFDISWDAPSITCGNVYYEVLIYPPPIEGDTVVTTVDSFLSVTGLNNSLPDVTITVTAINRAGRGDGTMFPVQLPESLDPPYTTAYNVTISSSLTPADLSGFDIMISWTRPIIDPCTTLPITGYYIHAIVTNVNGDANERIYTSNHIDDTMGDGMGRFSVSYNDSFDQELEPNANYAFVVNTQNNIIEIPRTGTSPSCDDELSRAVAISIVVTFIITLVVATLITYIITSMYYKHKSVISQEGDSQALTEDNKRHDPSYATTTKTNITMDTNPAYGTATAIKMDTNPAYATTS